MKTLPQNYCTINSVENSDADAFLKKRRMDAKNDDNTSWLLTFADLMTILVVFSFILFIITQKNKPEEDGNKNIPENPASFVSVAHANTSIHLSGPGFSLSIPEKIEPLEQLSSEERIIQKTPIYFAHDKTALRTGFNPELKKIALLSKKNPDSKIILTSYTDCASKLSMQRAENITEHLTENCKVERNKIFLQNHSKHPSTNIDIHDHEKEQNERLVDVTLVKAFWWL